MSYSACSRRVKVKVLSPSKESFILFKRYKDFRQLLKKKILDQCFMVISLHGKKQSLTCYAPTLWGSLKPHENVIGKQVGTQNMLINYINKEKLMIIPIWDKPKSGVGTSEQSVGTNQDWVKTNRDWVGTTPKTAREIEHSNLLRTKNDEYENQNVGMWEWIQMWTNPPYIR